MKTTSIAILALVSLIMVSPGQNATAPMDRPPMRKAPTNEELVVKLRQSEQEMAKAAAARPASSPIDPRGDQPAPDLFSSSEILCYNGAFTLLPKRAVLQFPQTLRDRLKVQQGAKVQSWSDFFVANRNWITTVEVSKSQASGAQPLPEETTTHIAKCGKLVVATFQGHPISVHPVPVPETPAPNPAAPGSPVSSSTPAVSKP
ncbi:MAG: hypothetical protein EOP88_07630 [Verrucomicrobiaceae bacterium]|nr:MAG: hypothetical protein EOP88_07630 [Verrucomicrobiaceae bacterium]